MSIRQMRGLGDADVEDQEREVVFAEALRPLFASIPTAVSGLGEESVWETS